MLHDQYKALPPGTVLREWRLEEVLASDRAGIIYAARGLYFDEPVAIKAMRPGEGSAAASMLSTDADARHAEALALGTAMAQVSRPWREPFAGSDIRDCFEIHGTSYLVMDFQPGTTLAQMLESGETFTEADLLALLSSVAAGLDRAHRVGVLHGDIRPENILVHEDGTTAATGFGGSPAHIEPSDAHDPASSYAAIEQLKPGLPQGPWTDVHGLAAVLYACVTGEPPLPALNRRKDAAQPALQGGDWPGFSQRFLDGINAGLEVDPSARPQSIEQWLDLFDPGDADPVATGHHALETAGPAFQRMVELPEPKPGPASRRMPAFEPLNEAPEDRPPTTARPGPAVFHKSRFVMQATAVATVLFVTSALFWPRGEKATEPERSLFAGPLQIISTTEAQAGPVAVDLTGFDELMGGMSELTATARAAARPAAELRALDDATRDFDAMLKEARALSADPRAAHVLSERLAALNRLAALTGKMQAEAVARDADSQFARLRNIMSDLPSTSSRTVHSSAEKRTVMDTLAEAKAKLDENASAATNPSQPMQAIAAARRSIEEMSRFQTAHAAAELYASSLLRGEIFAIEAMARQRATNIIQMGRVRKPGLFAGSERRQGWRVRKHNAARVKSRLHELDRLTRVARTASIDKLAHEVDRARNLRKTLAMIETSSWAALPSKDDGLF